LRPSEIQLIADYAFFPAYGAVQCFDQHLRLDELAAGARSAFIPVVTGVLYAVGLRPRYRENDALTDVRSGLNTASISSPIGPDSACAADQ
jgi:hypothetical protein